MTRGPLRLPFESIYMYSHDLLLVLPVFNFTPDLERTLTDTHTRGKVIRRAHYEFAWQKSSKFNYKFLIVVKVVCSFAVLVSAGWCYTKQLLVKKSSTALCCAMCAYCRFNKISVSWSVEHPEWISSDFKQRNHMRSCWNRKGGRFRSLDAIFSVLYGSLEAVGEILPGIY